MKHLPVLLDKVLEMLEPVPGKFIIDGTVDGGGHAAEIVKRLRPGGVFLGIDWDGKMLAQARERIGSLAEGVKVILVEDNYANLPSILRRNRLGQADGLLLDLGFSTEQLASPVGEGRGFSFLKDEPLIMRYSSAGSLTAASILNEKSEKELADIFWKYGEEKFSRRIARRIVEVRRRKRIVTTFDLVEVIKSAVPKNYERGRINPATRVFQALRIYLNRELDNLSLVLENLPSILKPGGVAVIISFHSLEDRLVKNNFRLLARQGYLEILTKKPITSSTEEKSNNPRSRSAKLRAALVKIAEVLN